MKKGNLYCLLFLFMSFSGFAQCPTPTNDATMATTGSGANPAHTLAPISYLGTVTAGADETRMLVYMNTVNQFDIPAEITAAEIPAATTYGTTIAFNGKGQQLMANWDQISSRFFVAGNLKPSTTYYFYTVKVARCGTTYTINSEVATGNVIARTTSAGLLETYKAHDVVFGTIGDTNIPINSFTGITQPTTPTGYVIKMNTTNSFTPVTDGTDPATLTADPAYAGGEQIVYVGTSTSPNIDITGLTIDTQYFFKIYAYRNNYYQQTGYTFIQSTTTSKVVPTINLRASTTDNMSINTTDASVSLYTSCSSPSLLMYQIIEAPYGTSIGATASQGWTGSELHLVANLVPNHAGNIVIEVTSASGSSGGLPDWTTNKIQFTITADKVDPTISLENLLAEEGSVQTLANPSNSDGLFTYSIEGTANGNSLSGNYNKTLTVGTANTVTTLRASVAESDRFLGAIKDVFISAAVAKPYYFLSGTKLMKYTGGSITTLVDFSLDGAATGATPSVIELINGKIWGTTSAGGTNGKGVLFMVDTDGTNFTKITDFTSTGATAGAANLAELNGKVWGLAVQGGSAGSGSLYMVNIDGTGYQEIHDFTGTGLQFAGQRPVLYNGKIYGGSFYDATNFRGGIFSINTDGTGYTVDHLADASHASPYYGMTVFNNKLWTGNGSTLYAYNPTTKAMDHSISSGSGTQLTTEVEGVLYGVNSSQIFKVNASNTATETVHTFAVANDIINPADMLTYDGGKLVGIATNADGTKGVLYSISPDGTGLQQIYKSTTETFVGNVVAETSKLTPTITFANQTVNHLSVSTLGATSNSTSPITYELISDVTGSSLNGSEFTAGNAGTVTIRASVAANSNFNAATKDATFTIQKIAPTITLADITKVYGDANFQVAATSNSTGAITYAFTTSNTGSSVVGAGDEIQLGTTLGSDNLQVSVAADANFLAGTLDVSLTIGKRTLTVTADAQSRPYGDTNPTLTYTITNFAHSEDQSVINSLPSTPNTTALEASNAGAYPITLVQDAADDFYDFTYVDGTLTVNKAVLTFTANDITYVVRNIPGGYFTTPNIGFTLTGFKLGQDINDLNSSNLAVNAFFSNCCDLPGTTDITPYNEQAETNYTFNKVNGTLTKSHIPITATATNTTIGYNDPIPTFAFTYSSAYTFQDWTIDTPPTFSTTAVQGDALGDYPITGSGGSDDLYSFVFVDGTLTIAKKDQTLAFPEFSMAQVGDAAIELSANTQQGLPVTYTSSNTAVATISGNLVNIVGAGETVISASAAGDALNNALISGVSRKLSVFNNPSISKKVTLVSTDGVAQLDASNVLSYLYAFDADANEALGTNPTGAPLVTGNKIWGTTTQGGNNTSGVIFRMNHDGSGYEVVYHFGGGDNSYDAIGSLIEVGDKIYGMTAYGGTNDNGVIFSIDATGANFTIIHQFDGGNDNNGDNPNSGLFYSNGKLWGTTNSANNHNGIVFNVDLDGSNFTVVHGFNFSAGDASDPIGGLLEANGKLWGTTERGGVNNGGAIYSVGLDGIGYQVEAELSVNSYPESALTPVGDKLYGLARGSSFSGTERGYLFSIDNTGQNFTLLHDFTDGTSSNGIYPTGILTMIEGELWGVTTSGGANNSGVIFKYNPDTDTFTKVVDFDVTHRNPSRTAILPIYESTGGAIAAEDITFNAPASFVYDNSSKTYTITPNPALTPSIAASEFDLTYEGRNGTTYANSATAPVDAGDYTVLATVKVSNTDYSGTVKENFTIAPYATTIVLNLPGSALPYNGSPQAISPTANDLGGSPTLALVTEYSVSGAGSYSTTAPTDAGTYDVRVNLDASETNYSAAEATGSYTIDPTSQVITFNAIPEVACGQTTIDLTLYATSSTGHTLTFASSNTAVATISGGIATIVGDGTTTITASQAGDANVGAAADVMQDLTVSATQDNFSVDNPADIRICDASSYVLPALTSGDYYTGAGGTGTLLSAGATITSTTTLYVYGVSLVNSSCTDENSFTITIAPLPIDNLADATATGFYTLPVLTNGNYYTGTGGTGSALNAGDQITTTQTIYIYATDGPSCTSETSFVVTVTPNPALHFDQAGSLSAYDYLSVPDDNSLDVNEFTFEAWVNFDQLNTVAAGLDWRAIFNKSRYSDSYGLMVYAPTKSMTFYHGGLSTGATTYSWSGLTAGTWHHLAVKYDATLSKASILIDGVEVQSSTGLTGSISVNTEPILIGASRDVSGDPYPFDGMMDEVRLWNYARTDAEISLRKDVKLQGSEPGLVLYYDFSEGSINGDNTGLTQVTDQSAAGNHATYVNFALSGSASNYVEGSGNGVQEGLPQTITFNALSNVTFRDANFDLTATASSSLGVTYVSSNTSVASISGSTVTIVGAGTTTITASQSGDATYLPAANVNQDLTVDPFATTIALNLPGTNPTYTGVGQGISPTANDLSNSPILTLDTEYKTLGADPSTYSTTQPINAGTYDVRVNLAGSETNYSATEATGSFTIDKAPLTATLNDASIVYGQSGANSHPTTYTGFVNSETSAVLTIATNWPVANFLDVSNSNAYYVVGGPYTGGITWGASPETQITASNYTITFEAGDITSVTARPINVTGDNRTITYGDDANTGNTVTLEANDNTGNRGLASGETAADFAGTVTFENITQTAAGTHNGVITPNGGITNSNYAISYASGDLTINKAELTVKAQNINRAYGAANPTVSVFEYTGFKHGDASDGATDISGLAGISGSASGTIAGTATATANAGTTHDITVNVSGLSSTNYTFAADNTGTLIIDAKGITVTADASQSKVYAEADPIFSYQVSPALEIGDNFTGTLARVAGENVGTHAINQGTLSAGANYTITYVGDNFEITQKAITVTADAGQSKVYGGADPASYNYSITSGALESGDVFTGALSRVAGENADAYAINQGTLDNGNYNITYVGDNFQITPKAITVTADAGQSKVYAAADPASYSYMITSGSLESGDALTGALSRAAGENVGNYAIIQGTLDNANYNITYAGDNFEITQKAITITADAGQGKVYGVADPASYAYSVTAGALESGDNFTGALTRVSGENAGTYAINQGTLSAGSNYAITYASDNFEIVSKAITVTANAGQSKVYGSTDPVSYTYQVSPTLELGDGFTGALSRVAGENAGSYTINQSSLSAGGNYTITYVNDDFTITQKPITVTADAENKTYGNGDPEFTHQITSGSLESGDALAGSLGRTAGEDVGTYAINQGTLDNVNYNITFVSADLTINKRAISLIIGGGTKSYGDADPVLSYSLFPGSILVSGDSFTGALGRTAGEDVGSYPVSLGTLSAGANYDVSISIGGSLVITPRDITVTADAKVKIYGAADPVFTHQVTMGNLVNADAISGALARAAGENVGTYAINQGTIDAGSNYNMTYVSADLTINQKALTVAADANQSKVYGQADPVSYAYTLTTGVLESGDNFTGELSRDAGEDAGNYAIQQGTLSAGANYAITFNSDNFEITARALTVTPDAGKTKVYGQTDPLLTYTFSPALEGSDEFSGSLSRATGEDVDNYAIEIGTLTAGSNGGNNYAITLDNETLSVTKADLTISAQNATSVYGSDPAVNTNLVYTGFVNGDNETVLDVLPSVNTTATTASGVGAYAATLSGGSDNNYSFILQDGTLNVIAKDLIISAVDRTITFGDDANTGNTVTYSGFVNGEDESILTGALTFENISQTDVGTYTGVIVPAGLAGANYLISFINGNLTISKAQAAITLSNLEQEADGTAKSPTVVTSPEGLNFLLTFDGSTDAPTAAGSYEVVATIDETNYEGQVTGTLVLTAILDVEPEVSLNLYPNPAVDHFNVSSTRDVDLEVYDLDGTMVKRAATNRPINIGDLKVGLYLIKVEDQVLKLMVNR